MKVSPVGKYYLELDFGDYLAHIRSDIFSVREILNAFRKVNFMRKNYPFLTIENSGVPGKKGMV